MIYTPVRLLLLLVLVLSGGLASLWLDEQGQWRNIGWTAPIAIAPDIKVPVNPLSVMRSTSAAASYASIQERPLFAPDRRPPPPPPPPAPPDPFIGIQIYGIFSGNNGGILARVEGKVRRVRFNESIGGWTLKSVSGRQINFVQGEQTRQLRLEYSKLN
jgi:hypothetical protein